MESHTVLSTRVKLGLTLFITVSLIALFGTRPEAHSWNDGSRLASVESLVDRHTWVIDDSIFVKPPTPGPANPYSLKDPSSPFDTGTQDKLFIHGHFYSDKPPVASLYLAGVYWLMQETLGIHAALNPHAFIFLLTFASSGLAYILGVLCVWFLALRLGLSDRKAFWTAASFGLATVSVVYSRQVNTHVLQLGLVAVLFLYACMASARAEILGLIAGAAYTLDLGVGPALLIALLIYVVLRWKSWHAFFGCILGMIPYVALHHFLNYSIGGTIGPMNANPAYFEYPGSHFSGGHITGLWAHANIGAFLLYCITLWIGPHGFLLHNLPLLILPFLFLPAWRRFPARRNELIFALLFILGTWAIYAIGSTNYSGLCCSIRWFVPLLVPAFVIVVLGLEARPEFWRLFQIQTVIGFVLVAVLFWVGPWNEPNKRLFWPIVAVDLIVLTASYWGMRRQARAALSGPGSR